MIRTATFTLPSGDELLATLYEHEGTLRLYVATRPSTSLAWGPPIAPDHLTDADDTCTCGGRKVVWTSGTSEAGRLS